MDVACLIVAVSAWATAGVCVYAWRRAVQDASATIDRLLATVEEQARQHDERVESFVRRFASMRKDGFTEGGGEGPPPVQNEPLPAEIESFLSELNPESASLCRQWCLEQRDAGVPDAELYLKLTEGSELGEALYA